MDLFAFFESPTSYRLRELAANSTVALLQRRIPPPQTPIIMDIANSTVALLQNYAAPPHSNHPNFLHLAGLVSEAVLEVVFVALPGFLAAWAGLFDAKSQKFVAELNTMVFTPCLIFTKLASQLNAEKLADLIIIPLIFAAQTLVSYACAQLMAWAFGFGRKKMQKNFILAMGVFGNSNSLPISLVLSLSKTISGLHWDKIPGDNDNEVAARGILYLLCFQQLGQMLRWTWGFNVLLRPAESYKEEDQPGATDPERHAEEGQYRDDPDDALDVPTMSGHTPGDVKHPDSGFSSGASRGSSSASISSVSTSEQYIAPEQRRGLDERARSTGHITVFPNYSSTGSEDPTAQATGWKAPFINAKEKVQIQYRRTASTMSTFANNQFHRLPTPMQKALSTLGGMVRGFSAAFARQMNPPLWAMLAAIVVASVPSLQRFFFTPGTFVNNSITRAVAQSGGVAVPLILNVLGANLARSTLPKDQIATTPEQKKEERRLLVGSLLARMLLPTLIMAPILALMAKYLPISIVDDPIFVIVCFLITGAPSALQLAQICQINNVFMGAMSNLLLASYVFFIFPSTLTLVMLALESLEWAQAG